MCGICGCSDHDDEFMHEHEHDHADHTHVVQLEHDLMEKNNQFAELNRKFFLQRDVFALNLLSSPGSGKTTLLVKTIQALNAKFPIAVIEGDQHTDHDAQKIQATGATAIQINTGKGCHLDAHQVGHGAADLNLKKGSCLFIENVGNLVCPALFDLGEAYKVVILSVTEGEDKPLKYPHMFAAANLMLINKMDLLPYVEFSVEKCLAFAKHINPEIKALQISATTGLGMDHWFQWLENARKS